MRRQLESGLKQEKTEGTEMGDEGDFYKFDHEK
jgi:hypothetical protein